MLGTLGDLVEDVVVWLDAPIRRGADTPARVFRLRGGSAANVAAQAAAISPPGSVRFLGQVGGDDAGHRLVSDLEAAGVRVCVRRAGRTGTIVVLVEPDGQRTMLPDRGTAVELDSVPAAWLTGLGVLHVPAYSLEAEPLAAAARSAARAVAAAGGEITVDASSVSVIDGLGPARIRELLVELAPAVLFANGDEAARLELGDQPPPGVGLAVVKHGAEPARLLRPGCRPEHVPTLPLPAGTVLRDTTGAGDAFAAGFLVAWRGGADAVDAARAGHRQAAATLALPGATLGLPRPAVGLAGPTVDLPDPTAGLAGPTVDRSDPTAGLGKPTVDRSDPTADLPATTLQRPG